MTPDLSGFTIEARKAIGAAESEARELGHAVVGTEHLLLGLLGDDATGAAGALHEAGATLSAARAKVREAVGQSPAVTSGEPLSASPRATRALSRAERFSHAQRSPAVTSEQLLQGVLDVEGRAGQVLRGLGVDVERLRAVLDGSAPVDAAPRVPAGGEVEVAREVAPATCPSCDAPVDGNLAWHTVTAVSAEPDVAFRDVLVFSCAVCGATLGVASA